MGYVLRNFVAAMEGEEKEDKKLKMMGKKLRLLRLAKGYGSYDFFAWEHDIPRMQYLNMEQGKNYTMKSLFRVLEALDVTPEEFFKGIK